MSEIETEKAPYLTIFEYELKCETCSLISRDVDVNKLYKQYLTEKAKFEAKSGKFYISIMDFNKKRDLQMVLEEF